MFASSMIRTIVLGFLILHCCHSIELFTWSNALCQGEPDSTEYIPSNECRRTMHGASSRMNCLKQSGQGTIQIEAWPTQDCSAAFTLIGAMPADAKIYDKQCITFGNYSGMYDCSKATMASLSVLPLLVGVISVATIACRL